jgi:hypothetical protein
MACCYVEITGKDAKKRFLTTDAVSAYDAIEQAFRAVREIMVVVPEAVAIVRRNE